MKKLAAGAIFGTLPILWGWDIRNWQWWVFVIGVQVALGLLLSTKKDESA